MIKSLTAYFLLSSVAIGANFVPGPDSDWYARQMMPDYPAVSCCGVADAYWADDIEVVGDKVFAIITDDRDVPYRPNVPVGTRVEIPPAKNKDTRVDPNPTGHAIVFISVAGYVWCYIPNGGV